MPENIYTPTAEDQAVALRVNICTRIKQIAAAKAAQANQLKLQKDQLSKMATSLEGSAALGEFAEATLAQIDAL